MDSAAIPGFGPAVHRQRQATSNRIEEKKSRERISYGEKYEELRRKGLEPFQLSVSNKGAKKYLLVFDDFKFA